MKAKKVFKIIGIILLILLCLMILFTIFTFIFHRVKSSEEFDKLKEKGYYNPVSVGDYSLNVAKFGNPDGKHTIIGMAGLGSGDYPVAARQMTAELEKDNLVVFVDRAGYGLSDDTNAPMTIERIVEDYRTALNNAGIKAPYILMPHSIGGVYATYWVSKYPDEIEAVAILDGSELDDHAFEDLENTETYDKFLSVLAKIGFSRYVMRDKVYLYPENFSDEEQYLGDALMYLTMDSKAVASEAALTFENAQTAWKNIAANDVPKLYVSASLGAQTKEEMFETARWINRQIERNHLNMPLRPTQYEGNEESVDLILSEVEKARQNTLVPYLEKMGNCQLVLLPGEHQIFVQRPTDCAEILKNFIDGLGDILPHL